MYPTKDELQKRYSGFTDGKLLHILHNQHECRPEAVDVARAELAQRNVTVAQVEAFVQNKEYEKLEQKLASLVPLTFFEKVFYFFLSFFAMFIGGALRMNYQEDGLTLKVSQSKFFSTVGFVGWIVIAVGSVQYAFGTAVSLGLMVVVFVIALTIEKRMPYHKGVEIGE